MILNYTYTLTPSLVLKLGLESIFLIRHEFERPDKSEAELALDKSSSSLLELSAPPILVGGPFPPKDEEVVLLGPLDEELMSFVVTLVELLELLREVK